MTTPPPFALTKDEHAALCEHRDRPLTDDPIQLRKATPPAPNARVSLMDWVVAQVEAGAL